MIAVIVILILYITKLSAKPSTEEKISVGEETPPKKLAATDASPEVEEKKQTDSLKCSYGFGYLKKLDRNATIPDKCLSCPKIMECFGSTE
jgi:hypothetical protein